MIRIKCDLDNPYRLRIGDGFMTQKDEKDRIGQILDVLSAAASKGHYEARLDFTSPDDPLGRVADAVNSLLEKTEKRITSLAQFVENQAADARRYRHIIDAIEESYFEVDLKGNLFFFNDSVIRELGYAEEELHGIHFSNLVDKANAQHLYDVFHGVYLTGRAVKGFDWQILKKNKEPIDVESSVALLRDDQGKPAGFRGVVRDVTRRKQAEDALRESESQYRLLTEKMSDIIWIADLNLRTLYVSSSVQKILGFSREERMNQTVEEQLTPASLSFGLEAMARELALEEQHQADPERSAMLVLEYHHKDGSTRWMETVISGIRNDQGLLTGLHGVSRNITERKKAEEALAESEKRYRMLVENIQDTIWTMDLNLQYTYLSPSEIRVTGFTPEEIMKIPVQDQMTPESYAMAQQILAEELELEFSGKPVDPYRARTMELETYCKDGGTIWEEVTASFNRDETGKPVEILFVGRNITERKKAQVALKESEHRYRMIVDNVNDMVWVIDFGLRLTHVSESTSRVTGFSTEESNIMFLEDLLAPRSFTLIAQTLAEELTMESSSPQADPNRFRTLELEAYSKGGDNLWLEVNLTFNRDGEGNATEMLAVGRNITERRKIEQALAESEKRYRMIIENMNDAIWTMDFNFQYVYLSPAIEMLTGYTPEEIRHIPLEHQLTPESMAVVSQVILEEFEPGDPLRPRNPETSRVLELEVLRKDGNHLWQELTLSFNRDDQGNPFELLGVARDISERKKAQLIIEESEKRYRMIVENMNDVIWTIDPGLQFTYVSPSSTRLTGYTPEEARKTPLDQLLTPASFDYATRRLADELALEAGGKPFDLDRAITLEIEAIHKEGHLLWMEITGTFNRDENGRISEILVRGKDITERKKAEEEKERLEKQLVQAQKLETVGRLAGGVAHDFNNMLSVILGYVDLVKLKLGQLHPIVPDIDEIEKAAVRSRDITTQLLAFSRKQIIAPKIVDLNDLVANSQKALLRLIGEDVRLTYHPGANLWSIKIDPSQVEQILMNLAINARDAMPAGGILTIATENITLDSFYCRQHIGATPGQYVRLSVSDNGTGMGKETLNHIFEPFFTTKETGKGTGLGLSTIYGIVNQNNGFVHVYSEPDHGTTFTVFLPRTEEDKGIHASNEDETVLAGKGNILLVEDDAMVLKITRGMLESMGYSVMATESPLNALSVFEQHQTSIDLVITDVIMPSMSGKDLRDRLVEKQPDVRVLFMSGYTSDVIVHHGVLDSHVKFLQKPFTLRDLARKVREVLSSE